MTFVIADRFFPAAGRFSAQEKARVLDFVSAFQENPAAPALSLERVDKARSAQVWSARVSRDVRAILHKDGDAWVAVYVDHHDAAYRWAERHEIGRHKVTGELQIVEVATLAADGEHIRSDPASGQANVPALQAERVFAKHADAYLLSLGVPDSWLPFIRELENDDQLLEACAKLPEEVAERLLSLAGGDLVAPPVPIPKGQPLTATPELRQRFYVVDDRSELEAVLDAPMERWIAFLHPSQRKLVDKSFQGPAKVTGSAGTGKTTVALHRARRLARAGKCVLLTTFVNTLAHNLLRQLKVLCTAEELKRITVSTVHSRALAIARTVDSRINIAQPNEVQKLLDSLRLRFTPKLDPAFVRAEWESVVQLQGISTWDEYRSARRSGRGKPLTVAERKALWQVFEGALDSLRGRLLYSWATLCRYAEEKLQSGATKSPFDAVLVDEVQDLKAPELRFLRVLVQASPGELVLFGDAGQRIYPGGFSLSALGIDVRGRSTTLRLNYRTTEQIRRAADTVLGDSADDMDASTETRKGTRSLLRGPEPELQGYDLMESEIDGAVRRIKRWLDAGLPPSAIASFARTKHRAKQLLEALEAANVPTVALADNDESSASAVHVGTMHRAKGLEFRAVLVLDCSAGVVPSDAALAAQTDPKDRENAEASERQLLYVAMTRARDELVISWTRQPSPFLSALLSKSLPSTRTTGASA
jgi:superfamily I DNA/RNA helicase